MTGIRNRDMDNDLSTDVNNNMISSNKLQFTQTTLKKKKKKKNIKEQGNKMRPKLAKGRSCKKDKQRKGRKELINW